MTKVGRKPGISGSTTSWFFVIVISTISLLTAWEYARVTDPSGPQYLAKTITVPPGGTAAIELPAAGGHEWMVIEVNADSHFSIRTDGVKVTGGPAANRFSSKTGGEHCGEGEIICRLPIQKGNRPGTISFFSEDDFQQVTLDVEISLKKFKRATGANGENFRTALLVVCLLVPLVWLTHRSIKVSQWLIVGTAIGLLMYIDPIFAACTLLFLVSLYRVVRLLDKRSERSSPILFWSLTACVCFLLAFKYGGFLVLSLFPDIGGLALVLPLGLSYFVIRTVDSLLRSYRGDLSVNSFRSYLCYLLFPATIPAGPIMSYDRFHANRLARLDVSDITYGISRILIGIAKKVLIADLLLQRLIFHPDYGVFDSVSMDPGGAAGGVIITYLILNFLFVYVDFSAYSDIAIGLGRLMGYRIDENFRFPVLATNLRAYWQRWHITLSQWCMRNIFIPMNIASRTPTLATLSVFLMIGIWHSVSLNWVFWAFHHGLGIALLIRLSGRISRPKPVILRPVIMAGGWAATILYVSAGHSFVSLNSFETSIALYLSFWKALLFLQ